MSGETVITIIGNLTSDPELRYTSGGLAVANFTIASTPRTFDKASNEWKDGDALFLRASVWREFAEHVAGSLTKGTRVVVTGRLTQKSYTSKEGDKRSSFELEIDDIGPSLKYATASLTRASGGNRGSAATTAPSASQDATQGEPWASTPPVASGDVWNTPGNFNDETPF